MTTEPIVFQVQKSDHCRSPAERDRLLADPGFGQVFTDHMIQISWTEQRGWHNARLLPYGPLTLDPATSVFHYAQEVFEGLKAYRQVNGSIVTFRPYANAARFTRSARRMAMPELPEEAFVRSLEMLVGTDHQWVPAVEGHSLYLRPLMIATQVGLGVNRPSSCYEFLLIASPAGSYFPGGVTPVSVWLSRDSIRAAPGGTGDVKTGANYAASFQAQREAVGRGYDQVVWVDAVERRWVEELGGMNLFFVYGSGDSARLLTPALTGTFLPGITRDSILELAGKLGVPAVESQISVDQWRADAESGALTEVFACGTAAVITPVGKVGSKDGSWTVGDGRPGPLSLKLREELIGIQYGTRPDPFDWIHKIC